MKGDDLPGGVSLEGLGHNGRVPLALVKETVVSLCSAVSNRARIIVRYTGKERRHVAQSLRDELKRWGYRNVTIEQRS